MNLDAPHNRRSFLKRFASALMVAGAASAGSGAVAATVPERVPPVDACSDDDADSLANDDMSDPGWSY